MAAGAPQVYGAGKENLMKGNIVPSSHTFAVTLHGTGYSPSVNTHSTWADVQASQITGTGYTAGGKELASITVVRSTGTVTFDASDLTWTSSTITAKYGICTKKAAGPGGALVNADLLFFYVDFDTTTGSSTVSSSAGPFSITWNTSGIVALT